MNDLTNSSKSFFAILFADDTSVFLEGKEYTHLIEMLNSELKKLTIWLNANKLTVNVKKKHITWCFTVRGLKLQILKL